MVPEKQIAANGTAETLMPIAMRPAVVLAISRRKLASAPINNITGIELRQMPYAQAIEISSLMSLSLLSGGLPIRRQRQHITSANVERPSVVKNRIER